MEYFHLATPLIMKDSNSNDYLGYVGKDGIFILSIPDLNITGSTNSFPWVNSICLSNDRKSLYIFNKNDTKTLVIEGDTKISKTTGIREFFIEY